MLKKKMMVLQLLFLSILLTGCNNSKITTPKVITQIKVEKQDIPSELLECDEIPMVPNITMQSEAAEYTVKLYKTAEHCKDKLKSIKEFVDVRREKR